MAKRGGLGRGLDALIPAGGSSRISRAGDSEKSSGAQVFREGNGFYEPGRSFELDLPESAWQKESYTIAEKVSDRSSV